MGCRSCAKRRRKFMEKVELEKVRREKMEKIDHLWHYFGALNSSCMMCNTTKGITCQRISPEENFKFDPMNQYVICPDCQEELDTSDYLKKIEVNLKYIEKYKEDIVDYKDFDVLENLDLAIRRQTPFWETKI
jgi:hypothetical protein